MSYSEIIAACVATAAVFWCLGFWTCLWVNYRAAAEVKDLGDGEIKLKSVELPEFLNHYSQARKFPGFGDFSEPSKVHEKRIVGAIEIDRRFGEQLHESDNQVEKLEPLSGVNSKRDKNGKGP